MALAEAETSFCVHLSVCLSQALFSSAQMISISLSLFLTPSLECQPRASQSQYKPLQADAAMGLACSPHMVPRMLSEPHIHNLDKKMRDSGSVLDGGWHLVKHIVFLHAPCLKCSIVRQTPTKCVNAWSYFFNWVIVGFFFLHNSQSLALCIYSQFGNSLCNLLYSELKQAWRNSHTTNIETVHNSPNWWISFITLIIKMLHTEAMFCLIAATWLLNWTSLQPQTWKPRQQKHSIIPGNTTST